MVWNWGSKIKLRDVRTAVMVICLLFAGYEGIIQYRESLVIHSLARQIIDQAKAQDTRAQIVALRDYVRQHVTFRNAPSTDDDRPFFRATAVETLNTGLGWCGEDTRVFINLADVAGIPAARVNLYGSTPHVIALVDLHDGTSIVVDAQNPPQVEDLEPLDQVMLRDNYTDYSTLNLRRLHVSWLFSRVKLAIGPLTYWGENPHAMKATLWLLLAFSLLALRGLRIVARRFLVWRGWVHVSSLKADAPSAPNVPPNSTSRAGTPDAQPASRTA